MDSHSDWITDEEIAEIEAWEPTGPESADSRLEQMELRRLLLCLEVAVRDCCQASQDVKSLLPSMNAVAQNIEKAALSAMRLAFAGCGGALFGALAMWVLLRGGAP